MRQFIPRLMPMNPFIGAVAVSLVYKYRSHIRLKRRVRLEQYVASTFPDFISTLVTPDHWN